MFLGLTERNRVSTQNSRFDYNISMKKPSFSDFMRKSWFEKLYLIRNTPRFYFQFNDSAISFNILCTLSRLCGRLNSSIALKNGCFTSSLYIFMTSVSVSFGAFPPRAYFGTWLFIVRDYPV
jgi:hypothetical protein